MATIAELRILFRAIDLASREINNLEKNLGKLDQAAVKSSAAQAAAANAVTASYKNMDNVAATATQNISRAVANADLAQKSWNLTVKDAERVQTRAAKNAELSAANYDRLNRTLPATEKGLHQLAVAENTMVNNAARSVAATERLDLIRQKAANSAVTHQGKIDTAVAQGVTKIEGAAGQIVQAENAVGQSMAQTGKIAQLAAQYGKVAMVAAAAAAIALSAVILKVGFDYNSMKQNAEVAFTGLLKSGPKAIQFVEELYTWTRKTSLGFETSTKTAQEFAARGIAVKNIIPYMETIANAAAAMPRPMEESMNRISYAIGQISQSAKLHSQDMRQLTEVGINAWGYLTEATGASIDEIQKDALKFGLTGAKASEIILAGMKKDFAGMLDLQRETASGQAAIARRNLSELAGIFTKPIFDAFVKGLKSINEVLSDPATLDAAKTWGQTLADAISLPFKAAKQLKDLLDSIPSASVNLPVIGKVGTPEGASGWMKAAFRSVPGARGIETAVTQGPKALRELGLGDTRSELEKLQGKREVLAGQRKGYGGEIGERFQRQVDEVDRQIEALKKKIADAGNEAENSAPKLSVMEKAMKDVAAATTQAADIKEKFADLFKGGTKELAQAELAIAEDKIGTMATRSGLEESLRSLDKEAKAAAEANKLQVRALDDHIQGLQRATAARDRAEQRADMVMRNGERAADRLYDAQQRAADRQDIVNDANKSIADIQKDIADDAKKRRPRGRDARLDAEGKLQDRQSRIQELRDKAAKDLAKFDEAEKRRKVMEAREDRDSKKDLTRFDRSTAEARVIQMLEDQRDKLQRSGEAEQKQIEDRKTKVQEDIDKLDAHSKQLQANKELLDLQLEVEKKRFDAADNSLPTQAELLTNARNLKDEFFALTGNIATLNKMIADAKAAQDKAAADYMTQQERMMVDQNFGGMRAAGGKIEKSKWYVAGEHGPEIVMGQDGMIFAPGRGTTNNTRSITNLAPIHVHMNGDGRGGAQNALDVLFRGL